MVKEGGRKLLEGMDVVLDLRYLNIETLCERLALWVQSLHTSSNHKLFYFIGENVDFSLHIEVVIKGHFFLKTSEFLSQRFNNLVPLVHFLLSC